VWERSLELQGVVVPRRFAEVCQATGDRDGRSRRLPWWVGGFSSADQKAGKDHELPSGDERAYR
jgi:hypothetical protein